MLTLYLGLSFVIFSVSYLKVTLENFSQQIRLSDTKPNNVFRLHLHSIFIFCIQITKIKLLKVSKNLIIQKFQLILNTEVLIWNNCYVSRHHKTGHKLEFRFHSLHEKKKIVAIANNFYQLCKLKKPPCNHNTNIDSSTNCSTVTVCVVHLWHKFLNKKCRFWRVFEWKILLLLLKWVYSKRRYT